MVEIVTVAFVLIVDLVILCYKGFALTFAYYYSNREA
jgi:hypothetical protein